MVGASGSARRVALVPWGTPIEVFLEPLGRNLDDFCERLTGGWLFGYAEALTLAGYAPTLVVSSRTARAEYARTHAPTGTPVKVLPFPSVPPASSRPVAAGLRRDLSAYRQALPPGLLRTLALQDLVLVQEYEEPRADGLAWWGTMRRIPVFASFQGGVPPWESAPVQRLVRGVSLRRLAGLLVGSSEEAERVVAARRVNATRVHRVPNPVDTWAWQPQDRVAARRRLGLPVGAFVVAWHGRVDLRRKGLDVLVEAWAHLCRRHREEDVRLLLVGGGPDENELDGLLRGLGVRGVEWLAEYAEPQQVRERLAACDVWVSASRHEGFAVAPLEAMASGRAIVLSDAPGARELVGDGCGHGGMIVPRGDAAALAGALSLVLGAAGDLDARGHAARRRVEAAFSVSAVSRQLAAALAATPSSRRR